jgi:hypothetical protein
LWPCSGLPTRQIWTSHQISSGSGASFPHETERKKYVNYIVLESLDPQDVVFRKQ